MVGAGGPHRHHPWPPKAISMVPKGNIGWPSNLRILIPHAEDRFTAKMLEVSAEIVRLISERLSNAKDSLGGPDAGFGE